MKEHIIDEIKRLASLEGGKAPGAHAFSNATGIPIGKWRGVYWARWSDALAEAGFEPNAMQGRLDTEKVLRQVAELCRQLGRVPSQSDMRLYKRKDSSFPTDKTITEHFVNMSGLRSALRNLAREEGYRYLQELIPAEAAGRAVVRTNVDGLVYLLKSGSHYKIGRSDNVERRLREITIALPERVQLVHSIKTDDPPGIEAYWHRRFASKRANGEWFQLAPEDIKAFLRRSFQ